MRRQRTDASEYSGHDDGGGSRDVHDSLPRQVLRRMGLSSPTWKTLVIWSSVSADIEPGLAWHTWKNIETWPRLSPLVAEASWSSGDPWRPGSDFIEISNLGFPLPRAGSAHRVASVDPGRSAEWHGVGRSLRSANLWRFEARTDGGVRICAVAVFHGTAIGLAKRFVARRWRGLHQDQLDGVVTMVRMRQQDQLAQRDRRAKERTTDKEAIDHD